MLAGLCGSFQNHLAAKGCFGFVILNKTRGCQKHAVATLHKGNENLLKTGSSIPSPRRRESVKGGQGILIRFYFMLV